MNPKSYKTLVWLVIILLILNVSTIGTIGYFRYLSPDYKPTYLPHKQCEDPHKIHDHYFRDQMGFSEEQMGQFGSLRDQHFEEIKAIRESIGQNRRLYFKELERKKPDLKLIDSLNRKVGDMHYQWAGSSTEFMLQAGSICTDDQRPDFHRLMRKNFHNHMETRGRGSNKEFRRGVRCTTEE